MPAEIVDGDGLDVIASRLVEAARADGVALTGEGGLLPALLSRVLSAGLEDFPDPESWVREALPTLTTAGRRRLANLNLEDPRSAPDWLAGVPGLDLGKALSALHGRKDRQRWLGEIFGLSRAILREESHAA